MRSVSIYRIQGDILTLKPYWFSENDGTGFLVKDTLKPSEIEEFLHADQVNSITITGVF